MSWRASRMAATISFHRSVRQRPRSSLQFSKPHGCVREQEPHEACPLEPQLPAGATPIPVINWRSLIVSAVSRTVMPSSVITTSGQRSPPPFPPRRGPSPPLRVTVADAARAAGFCRYGAARRAGLPGTQSERSAARRVSAKAKRAPVSFMPTASFPTASACAPLVKTALNN